MRFILGLCVVAGCTLCGSAMAGAQRRRVRLLESVINGLRLLKLHTVSMFEPLPQALGATGCAVLEGVGSQMTPGASAAQAWEGFKKREGRRGGGIDALSPEDVRALDELFSLLGESGRDQQEIALGNACAALSVQLENARRRAAEADRLYVSLGSLIGLMIALVMI